MHGGRGGPVRRSIVLGAVAMLAIGLFVFQTMSGPPSFQRIPCDSRVQTANASYCMAEVDMPHCEEPAGSKTAFVNVVIGNFSFSMRIENCFVPGALVLNGSCAPAGGASSAFRLYSRQVPDEEGWISWFSTDARAAVRWTGAYSVQIMEKID